MMTDKQKQAIENLQDFVACKADHTFMTSPKWWYKFNWLDDRKNLYRCFKLPPTCQETQNIFNFLIKSMKKCNKNIADPNSYQNQLDRINAESVYDGYWDNPLF